MVELATNSASRIAVNFDLSVKECKEVFGGSRSKAYRVLKKDLTEHGFLHDQGSGYISDKELSHVDIIGSLKGLFSRNEWLNRCCKKLRVTRIAEDIFSGEAHGDLLKALDKLAKSEKPKQSIRKKIPKKVKEDSAFETITVGELAERRKRERALKSSNLGKDGGNKSPDRGGAGR